MECKYNRILYPDKFFYQEFYENKMTPHHFMLFKAIKKSFVYLFIKRTFALNY